MGANNSAPCKVSVNPWSVGPEFDQTEQQSQNQQKSVADQIFAV